LLIKPIKYAKELLNFPEVGPELFHRALYHRIVSYVFALYNRNPKFMSITSLKWYKKDSYSVVNGISVSESLWRESPDLYIGLAIDIVYQM